ncbi:glycosyltransferase family 25 protein [Nitratireductor sp. XY-223]|uniref:glycosyltransferase family 25 protein n=1 Tax=Nitratireductor sp. XY-223 TaxID=2561926 RepID=UPI0010AB2256|nr:glycosyltransferase family 25 protein [Nitratireductor sp. XY-223]
MSHSLLVKSPGATARRAAGPQEPKKRALKVYLINLDRSADRLRWFVGATRRLDFDLVRIPAVDGSLLPESKVAEYAGRASGEFGLTRGDIGCFLSHRNAWRLIAEAPDRWAFVAEDDAHFSDDSARFFQSDDWLPDDADIVKAETVFQNVRLSGQRRRVYEHYLSRMRSSHVGTGGYFISRDCARYLLDRTDGLMEPVDQLLFNPRLDLFKTLRIYQIEPALCVQDFNLRDGRKVGFETTIMDWSRHTWTNPKRRGIAKIRHEACRPFVRLFRFSMRVAGFHRVGVVEFGFDDRKTVRVEAVRPRRAQQHAAV